MQESERTEWCYISGKVCVLESFLLKRDFFEGLISLEKQEEVFLSISDSPLKDYFIHIERLYEFERIIEERYLSGVVEIQKSSPDTLLSDIFLIKYDFINLKNYLKELLAGITRETPAFINIKDSEWERLWKGLITELDPVYEDAVRTIKENLADLTARSQDVQLMLPFIIDLVLDNAYLNYLSSMITKLDVPLITDYFKDYFIIKRTEIILRAITNKCDMERILHLFLADTSMQGDFFHKLAKSPHEGWQDALREVFPAALVEEIFTDPPKDLFTRFERATDNYLLRKLYPARYVFSGPERVFGYLCGFNTETYNLRLALGGRLNRVNKELLQERLREPYV